MDLIDKPNQVMAAFLVRCLEIKFVGTVLLILFSAADEWCHCAKANAVLSANEIHSSSS